MKLTRAMRDAIVKRLLERTRAPRDAVLRNHEHALAVRLLRHRYGDDVFERCRALPEGWLQVYKHVTFEHKFVTRLTRCRVIFSYPHRGSGPPTREIRSLGSVNLSDYAPLPASACQTWPAEFLEPCFDEIEGYARGVRDHEDAVEALRVQTVGVLSAYPTVELLSRDWPDGYNMLPPEMLAPPVPPGVPAVRIEDLTLRIEKIREAA